MPGEVPGTGLFDGGVGQAICPAGIHVEHATTHQTWQSMETHERIEGGEGEESEDTWGRKREKERKGKGRK